LHAAASYAVFLGSFVHAIGFVGKLWVPKSIDAPDGPGWLDHGGGRGAPARPRRPASAAAALIR